MNIHTSTYPELTDSVADLYMMCAKAMVAATNRHNYQMAMDLKDGLKEMVEEAGHTFHSRVLFNLCADIEAEQK